MGSFVQDLRKRIEKATGSSSSEDVNPLLVIGLTDAVLDLGLNEEQVYQVIRSFARQLAAQVHPDRKPINISALRQEQILAAFNALDDRENFARALSDFKGLKAEERHEIRVLRQRNESLRHQVSEYEGKFKQLNDLAEALAGERRKFEQIKSEEPPLLPGLRESVRVFEDSRNLLAKNLKRQEEVSRDWKRKFEDVCKYLADLSVVSVNTNNSTIFPVFGAKWVAVVSLSHIEVSPLDESGKAKEDFMQMCLLSGIKKEDAGRIIQGWQSAQNKFGEPDKFESTRVPMALSVLSLNSGVPKLLYGFRAGGRGGKIIGSVPNGQFEVSRVQLRGNMSQSSVLANVVPFLLEGAVMVSATSDSRRRASWSLRCPDIRLSTKRIIVAVG